MRMRQGERLLLRPRLNLKSPYVSTAHFHTLTTSTVPCLQTQTPQPPPALLQLLSHALASHRRSANADAKRLIDQIHPWIEALTLPELSLCIYTFKQLGVTSVTSFNYISHRISKISLSTHTFEIAQALRAFCQSHYDNRQFYSALIEKLHVGFKLSYATIPSLIHFLFGYSHLYRQKYIYFNHEWISNSIKLLIPALPQMEIDEICEVLESVGLFHLRSDPLIGTFIKKTYSLLIQQSSSETLDCLTISQLVRILSAHSKCLIPHPSFLRLCLITLKQTSESTWDTLSSQQLYVLLFSLAKIQLYDPLVFNQLLRRIQSKFHTYSLPHCIQILSSFSKSNHQTPIVIQRLVQKIQKNAHILESLQGFEVLNLSMALAKQSFNVLSIFEIISTSLLSKLTALSATDLLLIFSVWSKIHCVDLKLFQAASNQFVNNFIDTPLKCDVNFLITIFSAFGKIGYRDNILQNHLLQLLEKHYIEALSLEMVLKLRGALDRLCITSKAVEKKLKELEPNHEITRHTSVFRQIGYKKPSTTTLSLRKRKYTW